MAGLEISGAPTRITRQMIRDMVTALGFDPDYCESIHADHNTASVTMFDDTGITATLKYHVVDR